MLFFEILPFVGFIFFAIMLFVKIRALKKQGIKTGNTTNKSGIQKYLLFPIYFFFLLIILFELVKPVSGYSFLPDFATTILAHSIYLKIAGMLFIGLSILLIKLTLRDFDTSIRFGLNPENQGKLITKGCFAISRNPFFLSIVIYFLGVTFLLLNVFFIVLTILAFISIHFFILKEEKFMHGNYGDEYKEYSKKVRRYF